MWQGNGLGTQQGRALVGSAFLRIHVLILPHIFFAIDEFHIVIWAAGLTGILHHSRPRDAMLAGVAQRSSSRSLSVLLRLGPGLGQCALVDSLLAICPSDHQPSYKIIPRLPTDLGPAAVGWRAFSTTPDPSTPQLPVTAAASWVQRLPTSWQPYARLSRLEKPVGTWLLIWPSLWSIGLAAPVGSLPDLRLMALFGVGAVLLRGAGCTVNDLWDRDIDKKVERTRNRPLAAGDVTPVQAVGELMNSCLFFFLSFQPDALVETLLGEGIATSVVVAELWKEYWKELQPLSLPSVGWLGAQLTAGLAVLLQLNPFSQALGAASLPLVAAYPLAKRVTGWPQAVLGLTMNWGALLGWAAARGDLDWAVVGPLYAGSAMWTLVYDTIYAHQDKKDDAAIGVRSTALTLGSSTRPWLAAFSAGHLGLMAAAGAAAGAGPMYGVALAAAAGHLAWQVGGADFDSPVDCGKRFVSNGEYGGIIFAGIMTDRLAAVVMS
jgi:4-hydroxybenzoate polyprenyltransferase